MDFIIPSIFAYVCIFETKQTSYEMGLFEFHIFLPSEYPHTPPLLALETTANGTVRFNANLYQNGKVPD
jgi:ubiquitin-protein ligase